MKVLPLGMLFISNIFMTFAWYGHLKNHKESPLWIVIFLSWLIALFEYCFQVPANRWGSGHFTVAQLKVMQEVITMIVFAVFSTFYLEIPIHRNYLWASCCLIGAVYFIFKN